MITTKEKSATMRELKEVELVKPDWLGNRWVGIQHHDLVRTIRKELDAHDIEIVKENWFISGRFDGKLDGRLLLNLPDKDPVEGTTFALGVQHSNLGDNALKFAVGGHIAICSNGMCIGDYAVKRKHTKGVVLDEIISTGIDTYLVKVDEIPKVMNTMQERELIEQDVNNMLMEAGRQKLIPWSRIGQVDAEYHKPTFGDHDQKTAWGLYNAFTYVIQKSPAHTQIQGINKFREIVLN